MLKADAQTVQRSVIRQAVVILGRVLVALILAPAGLLLIYSFGAGYLSYYGLGLPTPWNLVASGLLLAGLLAALMRILFGPTARRRQPSRL